MDKKQIDEAVFEAFAAVMAEPRPTMHEPTRASKCPNRAAASHSAREREEWAKLSLNTRTRRPV